MAVAYGVSAGGVATEGGLGVSIALTHSAIASGDWALVAYKTGLDNGGLALTFGGVSGTLLGSSEFNIIGDDEEFYFYSVPGPVSANSTVSIETGATAVPVIVVSVTGAHATTPFGAVQTDTDTDGSVSGSITVPADGLGIRIGYGADIPAPAMSWTNATERLEYDGAEGFDRYGAATGTNNSATVTFTPAAFGLIALFSVPVSPPGAAGQPYIKRMGGIYGARGIGRFGRGSGVW